MAGNANVAGRSVTSKVGDILIAFDGSARSLTELSRKTQLPISTVHRLLTELVAARVINRKQDGTYSIGTWLPPAHGGGSPLATLRDRANGVMADLAMTTHRQVRLGVMAGTEVAYIERPIQHQVVTSFSRVRLPAHASALGKALLAGSPRELFDLTIAAGLARFTDRTIVTGAALMADLMHVRRCGMATSWGELDSSQSAAAVPVALAGGQLAALEVAVTSLRDIATVGPTLLMAARTLSRQVAQPPPGLDPPPRR